MKHIAKFPQFQIRPARALLCLGMASGLAIANIRAEDKYQMPEKAKFDKDPAAAGSKTREFMTYGTDKHNKAIPVKTVRITNNTDRTVYPIMRDPNTNIMKDKVTGLYDPYDPPGKEYRGYIGYSEGTGENTKYYFGLKPKDSILVSIPLVFWNAARMGIETGGQYLNADQDHKPNPLNNDVNAQRTIVPAEKSADTIPNGVVMWYRSELKLAPADDTEDQLVEWTIRDHQYLKDTAAKFGNEIPDNQLVTLINYDVSNVDSLYLPVSMEALDAWVVPQKTKGKGEHPNRDDWEAGSVAEAYGWTGAITPAKDLQKAIREFTDGDPKNPNPLLGQYFGGHGWPYYNFPGVKEDKTLPMKIPSGANVFPQSSILDVRSSYKKGDSWEEDKYMLSSGGDNAVSATIGWAGGKPDLKGSTVVRLYQGDADAKKKLAFVQKDFLVEGRPPEKPPTPNPIAKGTTVKSVDLAAGTVTLSEPLIASSENCAFKFDRPVDDYAANALIRLWYSWAQYYLTNWKSKNTAAPTTATPIKGSMEAGSATITFKEAHPELVPGMAVKGPGLDEAKTEVDKHQGDALILEIASDKKSVIVSQVVPKAASNQTFTFLPPQKLLYTPSKSGDPGYPLITNFNFTTPYEDGRDPYEFAQKVYLIMASMNQIGKANNNNVSKFMQDVIGANMGFIFDDAMKDKDDAKMVTAMIRDMIKSVLRGVSDFTIYPDKVDSTGKHLSWYPNPAKEAGGQKFNVFNLDPFVWFVHVKLGFSGYGFSVDDDTADVGAGGANKLQVTVTGTNGLVNTNPWSIQAPFGPLKDIACTYSGPDKGDTLYNAIKDVSATSENNVKVTTDGQNNLKNGDKVVIDQVVGVAAANGTFKVDHATKNSFELLDFASGTPIPFSGKYTNKPTPGRWSYPPRPYIDTGTDLTKVFWRVTGDDALGTFQGTLVSVNGVNKNKKDEKFRVWQLGTQSSGRLILNTALTNADGSTLPAGTYNISFTGDASGEPKK